MTPKIAMKSEPQVPNFGERNQDNKKGRERERERRWGNEEGEAMFISPFLWV